MIGDIAATFHRNEVGPYFGRITLQILYKFGTRAIGENMWMFKQQQMLFTTVLKERSLYSQNLAIRDPANPADAQHNLELARPIAGLENFFHAYQETGGVCAIECTMIPTHGQMSDWMNRDTFATTRNIHDDGLTHNCIG